MKGKTYSNNHSGKTAYQHLVEENIYLILNKILLQMDEEAQSTISYFKIARGKQITLIP